MSCERRYELDINFCDIQYEKIAFVLGEKEAKAYYRSCAAIAGDRLSNCKKGIMDTPKMPGSLF